MKPPILKPLDKHLYEVVRRYTVDLNCCGRVVVPSGYKTNGADIPRLLWRLFPPNSPEYMPAVVVHDYLCDIADEATNKDERKRAFLEADLAFREILERLGLPKWKVWAFYRAVRLHHKLKG